MSFNFEQWEALSQRERAEMLRQPVGKALALLAPGMNTYGRWPSPGRTAEEQNLAMKQMDVIARTYAVACCCDPKITVEIVKATAEAYLQGQVTIYKSQDKGGVHVRPESFPDVNQFRDACLQTFYRLYRTRAIDQKKLEDGTTVLITVLEPRSAARNEAPALEAPISKEELEAARAKISRIFGAHAPVLTPGRQEEKTA
jgi:hypothetical protein